MPNDNPQAAHRKRLVESWGIEPGSRVLEIGCGQGDTTAALAEAVGPDGHIVAVDVADRDYGAPLTLGEATDILKAGPLGDRMEFIFQVDILDQEFETQAFDYVVLAHSSWYFKSEETLVRSLQRIRGWAKWLCFAEWDLEPTALDQVPHLLAVLIQGQAEAFKEDSIANVRSPFSRQRTKNLIEEAGWSIVVESTHDETRLEDADWEIAMCARMLDEIGSLALEPRFVSHLATQIEVMKSLAAPSGNPSLPIYSILAET